MDEEDWDGWSMLTERIGNRIQLVGDDLFVTNSQRLKRGIDAGVANAILIKVNQIGTLTETLAAMRMAREAGYAVRDVAPLGGDRGRDDRRPGRGHRLRADQDRRAVAHRPGGQVQPAAADRRGPRSRRDATRAARRSAPDRTLSSRGRPRRAGPVHARCSRKDRRPRRTKRLTGCRPPAPPPLLLAAEPGRRRHGRAGSRCARPSCASAGTAPAGSGCWWCWPSWSASTSSTRWPTSRPKSQADTSRRSSTGCSARTPPWSASRSRSSEPATIVRDARALGMVRPGERPYVITGLGPLTATA